MEYSLESKLQFYPYVLLVLILELKIEKTMQPISIPRDKDWLEELPDLMPVSNSVNYLYEYVPHLNPGPLTIENVQAWYAQRAIEIEQRTGSIEYALTLLQEEFFTFN